jgi:hypothetical protein
MEKNIAVKTGRLTDGQMGRPTYEQTEWTDDRETDGLTEKQMDR